MRNDETNAGTWRNRFGFEVSGVGIESIEFDEESRQLVRQFASNKMNVSAYEGVSQTAGNMAAQQQIAQGIQNNGFGDGGGMLLGMNMAQAINPMTAAPAAPMPMAAQPQPQPQAALAAESTGGADTATSGAGAAASSHAASMSVAEQVETLKKLKELVDIGILSQEEFDMKKHEVLGL